MKALLASDGLVDVDLSALYGVFEDYSETDIAVIMENDIGAVYRPLILTDSFESESP